MATVLNEYISVEFRSLTGACKQTIVENYPTATVGELRNLAAKCLSVPSSDIARMVHKGKSVENDDHLIAKYGIGDNSKIHVVLALGVGLTICNVLQSHLPKADQHNVPVSTKIQIHLRLPTDSYMQWTDTTLRPWKQLLLHPIGKPSLTQPLDAVFDQNKNDLHIVYTPKSNLLPGCQYLCEVATSIKRTSSTTGLYWTFFTVGFKPIQLVKCFLPCNVHQTLELEFSEEVMLDVNSPPIKIFLDGEAAPCDITVSKLNPRRVIIQLRDILQNQYYTLHVSKHVSAKAHHGSLLKEFCRVFYFTQQHSVPSLLQLCMEKITCLFRENVFSASIQMLPGELLQRVEECTRKYIITPPM